MTIFEPTQQSSSRSPWPAGEVGTVSLEPREPAVVASQGTWTLTYVVGPYGIDDGGGLKVLWPIPSDHGVLQTDDPEAADYARVTTDGAAGLFPRWDTKAHVRPWTKGLVIDVTDGALAPGDQVEVVLGDRSAGGPGTRLQSYAEEASRIRVLVDPFATGVFYDVPGDTTMDIVAGPTERLITTIRPRLGTRPATVSIRVVDRYGNVATSYRGTAQAALENGVVLLEHTFTEADAGIATAKLAVPPATRLVVTDTDGRRCVSNPVPASDFAGGTPLLWGDTQGQTGETVGAGSLEAFFRYARDAVQLDFVTHSANDFQIENQAYTESLAMCDAFTVDGGFVAFGGFEWSGNTPVGGDHNVLYADTAAAPLLRSSHALVDDHGDVDTDARSAGALYAAIRERGLEAVCVPHVGGRRASPDLIDPELSPVVEIVSVHGWFEWFALDVLARGKAVGLVGASDDHSGRPGGSFPSLPVFGVRSGLAAVYTDDLSRRGIQRAMRARHTYATTGERILLDVRCGEHRMGDRWSAAAAPELDVTVVGTAPIEAIEVLDAHGVLRRWTPQIDRSATRLRVAWRGARDRDRRRVQDWSGGLTVEGARVIAAEAWSFDHPDHGIYRPEDNAVSWTSSTNGDSDGVELTFDQRPTRLHFTAGGVDLEVDLADVGPDGAEFPVAEGVDRAVTLGWLPVRTPPTRVESRFTDLPIRPGLNAYLVKVHQVDGHLAWASPLFVDL